MSFPDRLTSVQPSSTMAIADRAAELRAAGEDVIDLSKGDPDFPTPDHIRDRAQAALDAGETHYTPSKGTDGLRAAIAEKLRTENGLDASADRITVTPGGKQALFEVLFALVRDGDEVVVLDPSWVSYEPIVTMCGGTVRRVTLNADRGFRPDEGTFEAAIGDGTRAVILNTPANPTGTVFSRAELERLRDVAVATDTWVVADEIYEKLCYDREHVSIGSLDGMAGLTATVNGFSKAYAMTGWRLGYYHAPPKLFEQAATVQTHTVTCASSFGQAGALAALEGREEPVAEMRDRYRRRRDAAVSRLREAGYEVPVPDGAFYLFVPVPTADDVSLCTSLLDETGVALTPGSAFGASGYVRLSYTAQRDRVVEGIDRLVTYLE
jgi:aspartate aminotransferase